MAFLTIEQIEDMESAAMDGDTNAQINMALLYAGGESVVRDYDKAVEFLVDAGANAQDYDTRQRVMSAASGVHEQLQREISESGLLSMFKQKTAGEDISEFEHKLELNTRLLSTISEIMKDPGENYNDALRAG